MKQSILLLVLCLCTPLMAQDSTIAITTDYDVVILYEDGTWRYYTEATELLEGITPDPPIIDKSGPSVSDFKIVSIYSKWEGGRFRVIGEIKNNGKIAAGVEVEAIARDNMGKLVDSVNFWPASVSNIPSGTTRGVGYTVTRDRRATKIELRIVGVTVW